MNSVLRLRCGPSSLKNLQVPLDASDARHNRNGGGIGVTPLALVGARVEGASGVRALPRRVLRDRWGGGGGEEEGEENGEGDEVESLSSRGGGHCVLHRRRRRC